MSSREIMNAQGFGSKKYSLNCSYYDKEFDFLKTIHQLNSFLPNDISVRNIFRVNDDDHARFSALSRTYCYVLINRKDPFMQKRAYLLKNKLDITFANEQEILSLIDAKSFDDVINFGKELGKIIVVTRGDKGAIAIRGNEVSECGIQEGLKVVDLTGAGDLFAAGFLHGYINNLSLKESLEKGTEMASKIIQVIGARLS